MQANTQTKPGSKTTPLADTTDFGGRRAASDATLLQVLIPGAIAFFGLGVVVAPLFWKRSPSKVLPYAVGVGGIVAALWSLIPVAELLSGSERKETERMSKAVTADRVSPRWSPMQS
jgi:hypothetical protein